MAVDDWNVDSTLNTSVEGENLDEGMLPGALNNFLRKFVAALKVWRNNSYCKDKNVTIQATGGSPPAAPAENDWFIEYTP